MDGSFMAAECCYGADRGTVSAPGQDPRPLTWGSVGSCKQLESGQRSSIPCRRGLACSLGLTNSVELETGGRRGVGRAGPNVSRARVERAGDRAEMLQEKK